MKCPECGSGCERTNLQCRINTGAAYICINCGLPVNEDGTENEVLVRQPVD